MAMIGSNKRTLGAKEYKEDALTEHIYHIVFPGTLTPEKVIFTQEVPVEEAIQVAIQRKGLQSLELQLDVEVEYTVVITKRKLNYALNVLFRKDEADGET